MLSLKRWKVRLDPSLRWGDAIGNGAWRVPRQTSFFSSISIRTKGWSLDV